MKLFDLAFIFAALAIVFGPELSKTGIRIPGSDPVSNAVRDSVFSEAALKATAYDRVAKELRAGEIKTLKHMGEVSRAYATEAVSKSLAEVRKLDNERLPQGELDDEKIEQAAKHYDSTANGFRKAAR